MKLEANINEKKLNTMESKKKPGAKRDTKKSARLAGTFSSRASRLARKFERPQGARFDLRASRFALSGPRASRSFLCSSHTFKFIYYNLILKLKRIWIAHFLKVTVFLFEFKWNRRFILLKALSALRNTFSSWRSRVALDILYTFQ